MTMPILTKVKRLVTQTHLARNVAAQYQMRVGQPDWGSVAASPVYQEHLARAKRGRILIPTSVGGYLSGSRMESLLAAALTLRDVEVHVLLCDATLPGCLLSSQHYISEADFSRRGVGKLFCDACFSPAYEMFKELGVSVHTYSDFLPAEARREAACLARETSWEDIASLVYRGIAVGEHAMAGAIRFYASANVHRNETSELVVRRYLEAALLTAEAVLAIVEKFKFDAAVFNHGIYVPLGVVGEVARQKNVRVVNWVMAYRKQRFIFSHDDTYHRTLLSENPSCWDDLEWNAQLEAATSSYLRSRWTGSEDWLHFNRHPEFGDAQLSRLGVDPAKPCVCLLTNVVWDARIHYPSKIFTDMVEWVLKTITHFSKRKELQLLIRVHPAEVSGTVPSRQPVVAEIKAAFPVLPSNVFLIGPENKVSTYKAVMQCNAAIIYGTKTGLELAAMGIPVIVAGEAWVRNKGISMDPASEEEYFHLLDGLPFREDVPADRILRAKKYAFHFFFRRMIPISFSNAKPGGEPEFDPPTIQSLLPGGERGLDVICEGILEGRPFIYPAEELLNPEGDLAVADASSIP